MLTSGQIINKKFPLVKGGILGGGNAGYEPHAVELFVEEMYETLLKLEEENAMFKDRVGSLMEEQEKRGSSGAEATNSEDAEDVQRLKQQYETLRRSAERSYYTAEAEAFQIKEEAKDQVKAMIQEAQTKAENLIREANARFEEREREAQKMDQKAKEVDHKLKSLAEFILNDRSESAV